MTLGSLFDGSGGFPLAGVLVGITPVWSSEIEAYPLRVTAARFPDVKQLGDVTKINGAEIDPVDIITFGSPCQDLSVAGKQKGIHDGERSNLFFEAVRIIKEMRDADKANGRSGVDIRPRFAVWENVPGAFSSNGGEDFKAVLEALAGVMQNGLDIPRPKKWSHAGGVAGDGWSIAWRVYDAQYWGVPQRRKRIYLVADFATERAGEILFEREGLRGDSEESGASWEGIAADAERGAGGSSGVGLTKTRSIGYYDDGTTPTIRVAESGSNKVSDVCYEVCGVDGYNTESTGDVSITIRAGKSDQDHVGCVVYRAGGYGDMVEGVGTLRANGGDVGGGTESIVIERLRSSSLSVYDARGNGDGKTVPTITGDHNYRVNDYMALLVEKHEETICIGNGQPNQLNLGGL